MEAKIKCLQLNLHHSKAASSALYRRFKTQQIGVGLLQEPWVHGGKVRGLPTDTCKLIYKIDCEKPRAALLLHTNIAFVSVPEFTTADLATAIVEIPTENGKRHIVMASAYLPGDAGDHPPTEEVRRLVDWCKKRKKYLILGCDANAHHSIWGSTDINNRGKELLDFIVSNN